MQEFNQKLIFVSGKGGVGKSTIAAALAYKETLTSPQSKVLLSEIGDQSYFQAFFQLDHALGYKPEEISSQDLRGLYLSLWTGQDCLQEYARHLLKIESLYKLFFENAIMKTFIQIAPGLAELSIMGKMTSGIRKHGPAMPYDALVMDSFATGHFLALMKAPSALAQTIRFGPMGEQSRAIDAVLRDPKHSEYVLVCLPEELPTRETLELVEKLKSDFGIEPRVILNRCLAGDEAEETLKRFAEKYPSTQEFVEFTLIQKESQEDSLQRLRSAVKNVDVVPFIFEMNPVQLMKKVAGYV